MASPARFRPFGIFVRETGEMLIADSQNRRVILSDADGNILQEFTAPDRATLISPD